MKRRLHPLVWVLIGFVLMVGLNAWHIDSSSVAIRNVTKDEVSTMIDQRRIFFLQIGKKGCVYCETLRELEEHSDQLGNMIVYEVEFPEDPSKEDKQWLEETLPHFDYYPALFIVEADEIVCVDVNDFSEFDEKVVPKIAAANGSNHEEQR